MSSATDPGSDIARTLQIDHSSRNGRRRKLRLILGIVGVVVVAASVIAWATSNGSNVTQYKTQPVQRGDLVVVVTATGTLQPTNKVDVGSELSGIIKGVDADYNQRVKIGQVLARLDTSKLEAQVTQSRATLEAARAKVLQTRATVKEADSKLAQFRKVRDMSNNKVPSQIEMDAAEAAADRAKADEASATAAVAQAEASLKAIETDLAKSVIRSPINGVVLTRSVECGQTVAASFQAPVLFTLAEDLTKMELRVDVDEADVGKVREGQEASFSVDAYPNRTFQARIVQTRFGSKTVEGVVTYETVLRVDNPDLSLRPGMTATAVITVNKVQNALLVPNAALRFSPPAQEQKKPSGGLVGALLPRPPRSTSTFGQDAGAAKRQQRVWVLKDGQPSAVPVTIGATDGTATEVTAGDIQQGAAVVVDIALARKK